MKYRILEEPGRGLASLLPRAATPVCDLPTAIDRVVGWKRETGKNSDVFNENGVLVFSTKGEYANDQL